MKINNESLPSRCSICHQSDQYDREKDYCARCDKVKFRNDPFLNKPLISEEELTRRVIEKQIAKLNTDVERTIKEVDRRLDKYYSPATEELKQRLDQYAIEDQMRRIKESRQAAFNTKQKQQQDKIDNYERELINQISYGIEFIKVPLLVVILLLITLYAISH